MNAISATASSMAASTTVRPMSRSFTALQRLQDRFPLQVDHAGQTDGGAPRQFRRGVLPHRLAIHRRAELADIFDGEAAGFRVAPDAAMFARNVRQRFELQIHPVRSAAASDHHLVLRHFEGFLAVLVHITDIRKRAAFCAALLSADFRPLPCGVTRARDAPCGRSGTVARGRGSRRSAAAGRVAVAGSAALREDPAGQRSRAVSGFCGAPRSE